MVKRENEDRFDRILLDEAVRKTLYQNGITPENYQKYECELRNLFHNETEYQSFIESYFIEKKIISCRSFLHPPQKMDLFMHPRYIQQTQHAHDFFEMKYQLTGSGTIHAGSNILFLKEGNICLISPYVFHSSEVYTDDAVMINLVIPGENLKELLPRIMTCRNPFQVYFEQNQQRDFSHGSNRCMYIETNSNPEIRRLITEMTAYFSNVKGRSFLADLQMEADLERIFLLLLQQMPADNQQGEITGRQKETIVELTGYLRAHLQSVSLADAAEFLHFSRPYTSRYIRKETGYTFQMLLLILRMEETAKLLRETKWTVDRIAEEVGLNGKTNFYKQFRNFYGMSPAKYRDML